MSRSVPAELTQLLRPYPASVVKVALALRARVLGVLPNVHEIVWDAANAVSVVHGASERWQDDGITHIAVYAGHVNLGFNDGARLPDPQGVLAGAGSRIRHVTFRTIDEVAAARWIDQYVWAAADAAGLPPGGGDGRTTVRRSSGPKRRPPSGPA